MAGCSDTMHSQLFNHGGSGGYQGYQLLCIRPGHCMAVDIHGSGSPIIALDLLHYGVVDFSYIGVDDGVGPYQLGLLFMG